MANGYFGRVLSGAVGVVAAAGSSGVALGSNARNADVHQGRRADFPEQVRVLPSRPIRSRRCPSSPTKRRGPGPARSASAWRRATCRRGTSTRTVGIQHYKNDRSLSQNEIDTIVKWVSNGAPKGDPKDMPRAGEVGSEQRLELRKAVRRAAGPRHQVAQVHAEGRGDGRLVQAGRRDGRHRAPLGARHRSALGTIKGRKITHHALAYLHAGREGSRGHGEFRRR